MRSCREDGAGVGRSLRGMDIAANPNCNPTKRWVCILLYGTKGPENRMNTTVLLLVIEEAAS